MLTRRFLSIKPYYKLGIVLRYESTQTQPEIKEERFDFEDLKVVERVERRKPAIPPFMKNCMVSIFDRELLAFPEILNKDEMAELNARHEKLEKTFNNPDKTIEDCKNTLNSCNMYAAPLKLTDGGLAFNVTERIRYLETISSDVDLAKALSDHWIGLQALKLGLQEDQLQKLIPDLTTGLRPITLCTKETLSVRVSQPDFRSTAELDHTGVWRLRGEKICHNGSGYFLVLCSIEAGRIRAFLVHPNAEGITYERPHVRFDNTPGIPLEHVSDDLLSSTLGLSRLDTAVISYSIIKDMMMKITQYVRGKFVAGQPLAEVPTIMTRLGESVVTLYAAESMAYFTAGLLDGYMDPDVDLEIAMCRSFVTQHAARNIMETVSIAGLESLEPEWNRFLDKFRALSVHDEIIDSVNMFIALNGLHYAGKTMATEVKKVRNPLFNPSFIVKKFIENRHQAADEPKLTLRLEDHLHPSLQRHAQLLEYSVVRLRYACELLLSRHGVEVTSRLTDLERLSLAATEVLAMTAVLSRASRSYCIGLRNADMEMKFASMFVNQSKTRAQQLIRDIDEGEYLNLDRFRLEFGKKVLDTSTVLVEKPIERTFW